MPLLGILGVLVVATIVTPESERMVTALLQLVTIWLLQRRSAEIKAPLDQATALIRRKLGDRTPSVAEQDRRARASTWDGTERRQPPPPLSGGARK